MEYSDTGLWKRTLATQESDETSNHRGRLRQAYLSMRARAAEIVSHIHSDCPGITVHDISHLDALWEMGDLIAGDQFELNPVEAFVFGAVCLIHDAGMAVAAFPGGIDEVMQTIAWKDVVAGIQRREGLTPTAPLLEKGSELEREAQFATLRHLHASASERIATQKWTWSGHSEEFHLIEDEGLRRHLGRSIGRIAHSHHWDVGKLEGEFAKSVGATPGLPSNWDLNELKVACLLRCADAAHIDERRAPSFKFILTKPAGVSLEHWQFQNKLSQPVRDNGLLVYSSGPPFAKNEASAWWLAYDTISMINKEIEQTNDVLREAKCGKFSITGVAGANNPKALSKFIVPDGWEPVRAEIAVSNPAHLARMLGGANLYGSGSAAPLRELIQNAVDSVRARRAFEHRANDWGQITITVEAVEDATWLHVDDTGIGMSPRVLTGALIDFGRSFWASPEINSEFPGLQASGISPTGKFGIGFFSVFLLGDNVRVISKRIKEGDRTYVLEMAGLGIRPLLRPAVQSELPLDTSTRVSVRLSPAAAQTPEPQPPKSRILTRPGMGISPTYLKHLICGLDVHVSFEDKRSGESFTHMAKWRESPPRQFLGDLLQVRSDAPVLDAYENLLRDVVDATGEVKGRAALKLALGDQLTEGATYYSVGGFTTPSLAIWAGQRRGIVFGELPDPQDEDARTTVPLVGLLAGNTTDVSRRQGFSVVPAVAFSEWAGEQAKLVATGDYSTETKLVAGQTLYGHGFSPEPLPVAYFANGTRTLGELRKMLSEKGEVWCPIRTRTYENNYDVLALKELQFVAMDRRMAQQWVFWLLSSNTNKLLSTEFAAKQSSHFQGKLSEQSIEWSGGLNLLARVAKETWGDCLSFSIEPREVFDDRIVGLNAFRTVLVMKKVQI